MKTATRPKKGGGDTKKPLIHVLDREKSTEEQSYAICGTPIKGELHPGKSVDCVVCIDMFDHEAKKRKNRSNKGG